MSVMFRATAAFLVGLVGGYIFLLLHAPLPWTLGSLAASAIVALTGRSWFLPPLASDFARPCVGVLAGSAFTLPVLISLPGWWDVLVVLMIYSIIVTILGSLYFQRVAKFDPITAFFASAPGGLGELSLLGSTLGGNLRTLVLVHSMRIITVVFVVPFAVRWYMVTESTIDFTPPHPSEAAELTDWAIMIACGVTGFFIGRPLRTLGGVMMVPMIMSAAVHIVGLTAMTPPNWLIALVQIVVGCLAGSRFAGLSWPEFRTTVVAAVVWSLVLLVLAMIGAVVCRRFSDASLLELVLAFAPGGLVEITIVAYAMSVHVAFVTTCQLCRVTLVLLLTPTIFRLLWKKLHLPMID